MFHSHYHGHVASRVRHVAFALIAPCCVASAQDAPASLHELRARALSASPDVAAAREAVAAARGMERQAKALVNPVFSYGREQTGRGGQSTTQDVVAADQPLEWPGLRSARRDAAGARREAAEARLVQVEAQVSYEVARAYAAALAAERRAALADTVAKAFAAAVTVSERRLQEGDISGFAARRIRLEAARYASLRAEATLGHRIARVALAMLAGDSTATPRVGPLTPVALTAWPGVAADSLVAVALAARSDLVAAGLDVEAARADVRRTARERLPGITLTAGAKNEETVGGERLAGFVAGLALPLPLWDRRGGAVAAAEAETRRRDAELLAARRRVTREVLEAVEGLRAVQEQLAAMSPSVQEDAAVALRAAQAAYNEGEITLLEWLDTVRAWQETQSSIGTLRAELLVRAAALERAVGAPVFQELR